MADSDDWADDVRQEQRAEVLAARERRAPRPGARQSATDDGGAATPHEGPPALPGGAMQQRSAGSGVDARGGPPRAAGDPVIPHAGHRLMSPADDCAPFAAATGGGAGAPLHAPSQSPAPDAAVPRARSSSSGGRGGGDARDQLAGSYPVVAFHQALRGGYSTAAPASSSTAGGEQAAAPAVLAGQPAGGPAADAGGAPKKKRVSLFKRLWGKCEPRRRDSRRLCRGP